MSSGSSIRVLSIDDHPLVREGIGAIINGQTDMSLAGTASNGKEGMEAFRALKPDITLMDLHLPDLSGLDVMIAIRSEFPDARVIMLTTFEGDVEVQRALKAGARGYLLKSMPPEQMLDADSGVSGPLIPLGSGPPFRWMWSGVPVGSGPGFGRDRNRGPDQRNGSVKEI